ncbi:uncharacterized protein LOC144636011 [Oculina patagonica]
MPAYMCKTVNRRLVLFTTSLWIVLALGKENVTLVKRDTTFGNVKAMYNRFVSESTGKAKYTDVEKNACSMDLPPSVTNTPGILHVAASKDDFQSSLGCGACIKIIGSGKPAAADLDGSPPVQGALKGIIVDQDDSLSQGDLALLPPQSGSGLWEIKFKATDCPTALGPTGYIQFRFTGSNEMYFKLQAMNAKVPVAGIEAFERVKGKWFCLTRTANNYFTSEGMGAVSFPLKVRLTSLMNEQLEATINALKNDVVINSDIQFSDSAVRGGSPEGIQCYGQGDRPPSGEGDEGFCVSKEDGIYADPEDETAFYVCEGEKATKKFCPTGLKFNPVISGCDIPQDVKYVGNEADSPGIINANENTRWTSLAGNDGMKELYVGGNQVLRKNDGKTALNALPPHKLFSINIFNGAHSLTVNKLHEGTENSPASNERFQEKVHSNVQNVTTMGPSPPKENLRKFESAAAEVTTPNVHEGLASTSVQNEKLRENPSMFIAQKIESADNKNLNHAADQLVGNHRGESALISQNSSSAALEINTKHPIRPESFVTSDNRTIQAFQDVRNTNTLQGHLTTSPHKVFAINIYGSHPQLPNIENQIHTSGGNTPIGNHMFEEANQYRNNNFLHNGQKLPAQPLNFQSNQGDVLNAPVNDYQQENRPHADLGGEAVQEDLFTTNDSTSTPLHFKLKINMDKSGKQPVINCTLSQCSENDLAVEDYQGKDSQSLPNGSIIESYGVQQNFVDHKNNHGSQVTKEDGDFHITLTTDSSQPHGMKGFSPNQLTEHPMPPSHTQTVQTNQPQRENTPQTTIQSSQGSSSKEVQEVVFSHQRNDTTTQATSESAEENKIKTQDNVETIKGGNVNEHGERTNETKMVNNHQAKLASQNQEQNRTRTQDSAETTKGDNVIQHGERENEMKVTNRKESAADGSNINNSSTGLKFPLSRNYEGFLKKPVVSFNKYNDRRLQYANQVPSNETNISVEKEQEKVDEQKGNTKLQTSLQGNDLAIQLENNNIKNQFHEQGQLSGQDFVQIQSRPQLKIILKNPGKIVNPLKRRSDAKGHIVQILKSLIDRPFKLGSKNKEVTSMLSSLVNKPIRERIRGKMPQDDDKAIKDSGSIAQSILEANKEYLDAVAMQGMVFSDGDPETENMTNILDSYQGHGYQESQVPQWTNPDADEKGASTGSHEKSPSKSEFKEDWLNDEHLITRIKDSDGDSDSASGMGDKGSASGKPGKNTGSGGLVDAQIDGQHGASEVNAYKGGILKTKSDPKLQSFCIGKSSGIYTNPFERKSFIICSNGVLEERACPETMLFNPKEKMCDVPDEKEQKQRDHQRRETF